MKRIILLLLLAVSGLAPSASQAGPPDSRRVAFWTFSGIPPQRAVIGYVSFAGGEVTLDEQTEVAVEGRVTAVMWKADGRSVTFYDTGTGTFREIRALTPNTGSLVDTAAAEQTQVADRGAWLDGRRPVTMLDPGTDATPAERWVAIPPTEGSTVAPTQITVNGSNIARFVTAMAINPRGGGVIAVHPYSVVDSARSYRPAYLARINSDLEVTERIGSFPGGKHLALTAGATKLAYVNEAQTAVKIVSFPSLTPIDTYPAFAGAKVSFSPRGVIAISSKDRQVFRDQDGDRLQFNIGGVSRLRFAPCVGSGCLSFS